MATNTLGTQARDLGVQLVHYMRRKVVFGDVGNTLNFASPIPAGSAVIRACFVVKTAFDGTPTIDIGLTGTVAGLAAALVVSAAGVKINTTLATAVTGMVAPAADIVPVVKLSATSPTVGEGYAVIEYIPNNDL